MYVDALEMMQDENAKLLLRLHRSDIGNKNRIEELSKTIRYSMEFGSQQRSTRKRARGQNESFAVPRKVTIKGGKISQKASSSAANEVTSF